MTRTNCAYIEVRLEALRSDASDSYFIWSGWSDGAHQITQNLYIARMSSPTQISGDRVLLHEPTPSWQQSGGQAINEGPEILIHDGRTFLVYCKSLPRTWTVET